MKDAVPNLYSSYDGEYTYALVQDAVGNNKSKVRHRREKGRPGKFSPLIEMIEYLLVIW